MTVLEWLGERIRAKLRGQRFYGKLVVTFEANRIVHLEWQEGEKPPAGLQVEGGDDAGRGSARKVG